MAEERTRVRVVVRVRPKLLDQTTWVEVINDKTLQTFNHCNTNEKLQYDFESVFGPDSSQQCVYQGSGRDLVQHVLNGKNASILAYGPTGAGKTHTILGSPTEPGVIPRVLRDLFASVICSDNEEVSISFSYLEIYNEKVFDLLTPNQKDLPIRQCGKEIFVAGLTEETITSIDEFNKAFGPASKNRTTASTKLNERSSRSHSILLLKVQRKTHSPKQKTLTGKLHIIDLAGSEDNRRTGNSGVRLKESGAINSSLLALSQVVEALNKGQACIPYRSSKLTRLLQDSLGGNSHSVIIINLSPEESFYFDTHTTLNFARKSKKVINNVRTNITVKPEAKKRSLEAEDKAEDKPEQKKKRPKSESEATPKGQRSMPELFLSPLIRNQKHLEDKLTKRLENLEARLLDQMKTIHPSDTEGEKVKVMDADSTTPEKDEDPGLQKSRKALSDLQQIVDQKGDDTRRKGTVYADGSVESRLNLDPVSCSPLFAAPAMIRKRGFRSTARPDARPAPDTPAKKTSFNSELQQKHNEQILSILNTGTVKELQSLQKLGQKRAQLIYNWRTLNGEFDQFGDLCAVPGLGSQKFLDKFLLSNLVQL